MDGNTCQHARLGIVRPPLGRSLESPLPAFFSPLCRGRNNIPTKCSTVIPRHTKSGSYTCMSLLTVYAWNSKMMHLRDAL